LTQLTNDHSLVAELVRSGGLTEDEARNHPQRNVLTRALGTTGGLDIAVEKILYCPSDRFLLCSDGLTGVVSESDIARILKDGEDLQQIADNLVAKANDNGGNDNITVVVIEIQAD
jgi:protein phosphatase